MRPEDMDMTREPEKYSCNKCVANVVCGENVSNGSKACVEFNMRVEEE